MSQESQQGVITGGAPAVLHFSTAPQPAPLNYSLPARPAEPVVSHEAPPKETEVPGVDVLVALAIVVQSAAAERKSATATIEELGAEREELVASRDRAYGEVTELREQLHDLLEEPKSDYQDGERDRLLAANGTLRDEVAQLRGVLGGLFSISGGYSQADTIKAGDDVVSAVQNGAAAQSARENGDAALTATGEQTSQGGTTDRATSPPGAAEAASPEPKPERFEIEGEVLAKCEKVIIHLLDFSSGGFGIDRQQRGPKGTWRSPVSIICEDLGMTSRDWEQVQEVVEPLGIVDVESEKVHGSERKLRLSLGLSNLVWDGEQVLTDEVAQKILAALEPLSSDEDFEHAGLEKLDVGLMIGDLKQRLSQGQTLSAAPPEAPALPPADDGEANSQRSASRGGEAQAGEGTPAGGEKGASKDDDEAPKPSPDNLTEGTMFSLSPEEELELRTTSPVVRYTLALTHPDLWIKVDDKLAPKPFDTLEELMMALKAASGMDASEVRDHNKKLTSKELAKFGKEGGFSLTLTSQGRGFLVAKIKDKWPRKTPNLIKKSEPEVVEPAS